MTHHKFKTKARYIVALWLMIFISVPGVQYIYDFVPQNSEWYWYDIVYYYYSHGLMLLLLVIQFTSSQIRWQKVLFLPSKNEYLPSIELTAFIFVFSMMAVYLVFLPLSHIVPDFVNYWLIELPGVVYHNAMSYPILPNILSFLSLVVFAPVLEEIAFRGVLLHRWSAKWGTSRAIVVSSFIFGIVHTDPIGAMAFGVAMCFIYLKTQTLIMPILCHALNNFVVWVWAIGYEIQHGPSHKYTLAEFQGEWLLASVSAILVAAWLYKYTRSKRFKGELKLPDLSEVM